jgi:hypothetical protein
MTLTTNEESRRQSSKGRDRRRAALDLLGTLKEEHETVSELLKKLVESDMAA